MIISKLIIILNLILYSKYPNSLIAQNYYHVKAKKKKYQSINTTKNTLKGIKCIYSLNNRIIGHFKSTDFRRATKLVAC